jgi:hypothetical protein
MRVDHRGADIAVAEEFLNRADVVPVFKQMRLQKNGAACGCRGLFGCRPSAWQDCKCAGRSRSISARPFGWGKGKLASDALSNRSEALRAAALTKSCSGLFPLALLHLDHHPFAVDVADFEPDQFAYPNSRGIGRHQQTAVSKLAVGIKQVLDFLLA